MPLPFFLFPHHHACTRVRVHTPTSERDTPCREHHLLSHMCYHTS